MPIGGARGGRMELKHIELLEILTRTRSLSRAAVELLRFGQHSPDSALPRRRCRQVSRQHLPTRLRVLSSPVANSRSLQLLANLNSRFLEGHR